MVSPTGGAFHNGSTISTPFADFEQSYDAINPGGQSGEGSAYTVNSGDTLQSIAAMMWGDASLWYLLASANGLSAGSQLAAAGVMGGVSSAVGKLIDRSKKNCDHSSRSARRCWRSFVREAELNLA